MRWALRLIKALFAFFFILILFSSFVTLVFSHRSIKNTLKYVQIEGALFQEENEGFICKVASNVDEAKTLIEAGFDYVCELDDVKLFRRRK